MHATDAVTQGRESYARRAWRDAYEQLSAADGPTPLDADDLDRLAKAAYFIGHDDAAVEGFERAHRAFLDRADIGRAARSAFWLGYFLVQRGRHAEAGGWFGRAQRLLDEHALDAVECGYLLIPAARRALDSGDPHRAHEMFDEAVRIAHRFGDADLIALGTMGRGRALISGGDVRRGMAMLDEAMLAVTTGDVSPMAAGLVYCVLVISCRDIFDWRRAQEWTVALTRWCANQQDLKPYRGQCLVHRSEIMQLRGEWPDAMAEAQQACEHLADPPGDPVLGMAHYQLAELLRLRGEFSGSERAYRKAGEAGHAVQPGLALLRLAQGRIDEAEAAIRRVVAEAEDDRVKRCRVLAAFVEIVLAAGDIDAARTASDELAEFAADLDTPYLRAVAASARGAIMLADGDDHAACVALRRAWLSWQELDAPYEAAQVRLLMSRACRRLGDHDTASMELDAARRVFEQLGAGPALTKAAELSGRSRASAPGGLTAREVDVLRLVATGASNREVADRLVLSEKTVARHLSNIFAKLGVASRAAATAYAYRHQLV
ncbi:transcriptional regulator, LuxR family [Haloechinothrix alba]|uniref:Transcriptional regulator, LuxR family n=1 Tax=Haloechinothrix alba TaxID=664784 RepID=A0A238XML6_9PSEU|nr:LuxR family transcriptional regulator [Haloechinothrix alba]SNR59703.1 transcriptional regulator, LuxR family [Haloechinothrix alba]